MRRLYLRSEVAVSGRRLEGLAAVVGEQTDLGDGSLEGFRPGAFERALADDSKVRDILCLWNHDVSQLLGREAAATLRVRATGEGLEYDVDLPNTTLGRDVRELVGRGDVFGSSVGFYAGETEFADGVTWHTSVRGLRDVSPVVQPAYLGTSTQLRRRAVPVCTGREQRIRARARQLGVGK